MCIFNKNLQSPIEVKVEWVLNSSESPLTLSISALMFKKDNVINKLEDFVFYGTPNSGNVILSDDKSITCDALDFDNGFGTEGCYKMYLELGKVSASTERINIVVSINAKGDSSESPAFESLTKASFTIKDAAGLTFTAELNKTSEGESLCQCIIVGLIRRYGQSWRFEEEMELKLGGLELVYNEYMSDSIIKESPFNIIGDLNIVEKQYKEIVEKPTVYIDYGKTDIEKPVVSTQMGPLTSTTKTPKTWVRPPKLVPVTNVQPVSETNTDSTQGLAVQTREPYLGGRVKKPKFPQPHFPEETKRDSGTSSTRRIKFPKVKHPVFSKDSHVDSETSSTHRVKLSTSPQPDFPEETKRDSETSTHRVKFPKVKQPVFSKDSHVDSGTPSTHRRNNPKVKRNS